MKRLLISVRSLPEARIALEAGCDLLDIKEPNRGALGRADLNIIMEIVKYRDRYYPQIPISTALGELYEVSDKSFLMTEIPAEYTKWGTSSFKKELIPIISHLKGNVGVFYVDYEKCNGLSLCELLKIDELFSSGVILFDTCNKSGVGLLDILGIEELAELISLCRNRGLEVGLAGKIRREQIGILLPLDFQILALRSAVCRENDRTSGIDGRLVKDIKSLLGYAVRTNDLKSS